jgi:hypothetical protein
MLECDTAAGLPGAPPGGPDSSVAHLHGLHAHYRPTFSLLALFAKDFHK